MGKSYNQDFYEKMYAEGRVWKGPRGILGNLFRLLQRFELHRVSAAVSLLTPGDKILDIGCGNGGLISLAKSKNLFTSYYGVDLVNVVIDRAKKTVKEQTGDNKNCYFKQANLDDELPYKNDFFNTVTSVAVLEHIFDPYFGIREINRVLAKKGELILEVPNLVWLPRRFSVFIGTLPVTAEEEGWDGGHLHYFTRGATTKLLEENGFQIEYIGCTGIFSPVLNLWPSLLGGNIMIKAIKVKNANK